MNDRPRVWSQGLVGSTGNSSSSSHPRSRTQVRYTATRLADGRGSAKEQTRHPTTPRRVARPHQAERGGGPVEGRPGPREWQLCEGGRPTSSPGGTLTPTPTTSSRGPALRRPSPSRSGSRRPRCRGRGRTGSASPGLGGGGGRGGRGGLSRRGCSGGRHSGCRRGRRTRRPRRGRACRGTGEPTKGGPDGSASEPWAEGRAGPSLLRAGAHSVAQSTDARGRGLRRRSGALAGAGRAGQVQWSS